MLFNPEAGKTTEEILEIIFRRNPALKADMEELAKENGLSLEEFAPAYLRELVAANKERMKDPSASAAYHARMDRKEAPCGLDPLLRKDR